MKRTWSCDAISVVSFYFLLNKERMNERNSEASRSTSKDYVSSWHLNSDVAITSTRHSITKYLNDIKREKLGDLQSFRPNNFSKLIARRRHSSIPCIVRQQKKNKYDDFSAFVRIHIRSTFTVFLASGADAFRAAVGDGTARV